MLADDVRRVEGDGRLVKYFYIPDYSLVIDDSNAIGQYVHGNNTVNILFDHSPTPVLGKKSYSNI